MNDVPVAESLEQKPMPSDLQSLIRKLQLIVDQETHGIHPRFLFAQALTAALPLYAGGRLRTLALRLSGFSIGQGTVIWGMPKIVGSDNLYQNLIIGRECQINVGCFFELGSEITIGDRVGIGHQVLILTSSHEIGRRERRADQRLVRKAVEIGDGAWVGARCVILPGVTIGAGSVISAGTVVNRSVPPDTLVTGSERLSLARWR